LCSSPNIIRAERGGHVSRRGDVRNAYSVLPGKT
jgi:hypothetical protein